MDANPRLSISSLPSESDGSTIGLGGNAAALGGFSKRAVLWRLYLSHTLSTWNARTFEFGAVIFLAAIFPGTLFYASCYALVRSATAAVLSSYVGGMVDRSHRLGFIRQSIIWQRIPVAISCLLLVLLLTKTNDNGLTLVCFTVSVLLAGVEKLAFIGNTVSIERDWLIVVADSLGVGRQDLNSTMRRVDLVCKLVAPLCISFIDGYSTKIAIWVVFGQNALSVVFEYFAIAQVFKAVPALGEERQGHDLEHQQYQNEMTETPQESRVRHNNGSLLTHLKQSVRPWKEYVQNPAFLASFSLALLYLTVLSFASQMTTYLLSLGFSSVQVSLMRLVAVVLELSATCAAPVLMNRIGAVRSGLWFVNEQLVSITIAAGLYSMVDAQTKAAGLALAFGVTLSRVGLWGFDLSVQYLVQEDAPEDSRGSFSAIEAALQNLFELASFATTMIFYRPEDFKYPVYVSCSAVAMSAVCFAGFVRQKRGHLLHTSKCFKRDGRAKYNILPAIEEELDDMASGQSQS